MSERSLLIEALARMAARHAGRDPDRHHNLTLAEVVIFDDLMWRYPDFLTRAEAAYEVLTRPSLLTPSDIKSAFPHPLEFNDNEDNSEAQAGEK